MSPDPGAARRGVDVVIDTLIGGLRAAADGSQQGRLMVCVCMLRAHPDGNPDLPSGATVLRYFGMWRAAVNAARRGGDAGDLARAVKETSARIG